MIPHNNKPEAPADGPVIDYRLTAPVQKEAASALSEPSGLRSKRDAWTAVRRAGLPLAVVGSALLGGSLIGVVLSHTSVPGQARPATSSRSIGGPRADLGAARHGGALSPASTRL